MTRTQARVFNTVVDLDATSEAKAVSATTIGKKRGLTPALVSRRSRNWRQTTGARCTA